MIYHRTFKFFFYQMLVAGFLAILVTGKLDLISGGVYLVLVAAAYLKGDRIAARHQGFRPWMVFLLSLLFILIFLADVIMYSGEFALSVIHVAMAVSVLKLFTAQKAKDYFYLFLIAFGFLLISTTFTIDINFLVFAAWFLVAGIVTLMLFEIRASSIRFSRQRENGNGSAGQDGLMIPATPGRISFPVRTLAILGILTFFGVVVLTVPTFYLLPRLAFGYWQLNLSRNQVISGFSENTQLGDISSIKRSEEIVMYVKTDIPPDQLPEWLRWKGIALDRFDGRGWHLSNLTSYPLRSESRRMYEIRTRRIPERLLYQEFYVEPINSKVLFLARRQLTISKNVGRVYRTVTGTLINGFTRFRKFKYWGYSDIRRPTMDELLKSPPVDPKRVRPVLLDTSNSTARTGDLVRRIVAGRTSPYRKALALEQYLKQNYTYSLDMMTCPPGRNPIDFFLFDMKRGHCEYFASALAIMLRYAGIPSRVVNGFLHGEANPFNNTFVVRQSDAHSWVEAYFAGVGWVELDATPSVPANTGTPVFAYLNDLVNTIHFFWLSNVVNYDLSDQVRLVGSLREQSRAMKVEAKRFFTRIQKELTDYFSGLWSRIRTGIFSGDRGSTSVSSSLVLGLAIGLVLMLLIWHHRRFIRLKMMFRNRHPDNQRLGAARLIWKRFLKIAARGRFVHAESETASEFSIRVSGFVPASMVQDFVRDYHELRFNRHCPVSAAVRRLEQILAEMEIYLQRRKKR